LNNESNSFNLNQADVSEGSKRRPYPSTRPSSNLKMLKEVSNPNLAIRQQN
jgi:hypothetical protein